MSQAEKCRTEIIKILDVHFHKEGVELQHSDPLIEYADSVSITFAFQKSDAHNETVTQLSSGDIDLCPVRIWAKVVQVQRMSYPGATKETPVSAVWRNGCLEHVTSKEMTSALKVVGIAFWRSQTGNHK